MAKLDPLLQELSKLEAGTLILEPGRRPHLRGDGHEREVSRTVLRSDQIAALVQETAPDSSSGQFRYTLDGQEFEFDVTQDDSACRAEISQPRVAAVVEATVPSEAERLPEISELLDAMISRHGSDLHLSSKQKPRMRIDGELCELEQYLPPSPDELRQRLWQLTPERNRKELEENHDSDFALELPGQARFRVNLFEDRAGIGAVLRLVPYEIPTFEQLDLPEVLRSLAHLTDGLVLVTGPTGSGKSTTLAAIVDLVNKSRADHIITIEDPIEFVHTSKRCLVHQREPGIHTLSFGKALRAALREDPDVILVGEMRDLETIAIAIETAETGHLVLGTLHTTTAPSTIERIVDQFPGDRQEQVRMMLADSLRAVVSQTLLKKIDGGRVAAFEILISTPAVSNLIREGKTFQIASAMQTGSQFGMLTQTDSLFELVSKKIVTAEEACLEAADKEALVKKLQAAGIAVPKN